MTKSADDSFRDWEGTAFGFGYGDGEAHILPALKRFFELVPDKGTYNYQVIEKDLGPAVAWLLINALARHKVDALEYGTSPRFGWLSAHGKRLQAYMATKSAEELYDLAAAPPEDYIHCYPDACNCGPRGHQRGVKCDNPFWRVDRP